MKDNKLIIKAFNEIDIYEASEEQIINMKQILVRKTDVKQLQEQLNKVILDLSNVSEPSFMADAKWIIEDNQKRLTLINQLTNYFELYTKNIDTFKKNKLNCNYNYEYIFNFILNAKNLFDNMVKYGEFKDLENKQNIKQLENYKKLLLKEGD